MAKGCALSTGSLPRGGLPWKSADRITDRPEMTSAVDRGRKKHQLNSTKKLNQPLQYKHRDKVDRIHNSSTNL